MKRRGSINTSKGAEKMLAALVKEYEQHPWRLLEPGYGLDAWDLAAKARIIPTGKVEEYRQAFFSGFPENITEMASLIERRGWVKSSDLGVYGRDSPALWPTPEGIDYAHWLTRPWHRKALDALRSGVGAIVVRVIAGIIIALLTAWLLRILGLI